MTTKTAIVYQVNGTSLVARADSNHWVAMDTSEANLGQNAGATPKELLLLALGGCTAMDVIPIMTKKKVPFTDVEIRVTGTARDEYPQIFTAMHIEYIITGDGLNTADIERAIELSHTKYCSVSAMLSGTVKITHSTTLRSAAANR